ncbi:MAG TPA: hypothetical protein VHT71_22440 [Methylomirabilota bacterium]|jgi:hypothetical protein|nr:hypothetical protein [Methylomirabilota bacterium]
MWIGQTGLAQIDTKVRYGATDEVDRLLEDLLAEPATTSAVPSRCPTCQRDLVRQSLAVGSLSVSACPGGHGAWLSTDVADSLRAFVDSRIAHQRRQQLGLVSVGVALAGAVLVLWLWRPSADAPPMPDESPASAAVAERDTSPLPPVTPAPIDKVDSANISEGHWPDRRWPGARPIPLKESHIDVHEELVYFDRLLTLLEAGISNRLNIEGVLATPRAPERYTALYGVYRTRQEKMLDGLRRLVVPARVQPIHEQIVHAAEQQIAFYGDYAKAKAAEPATDLRKQLSHPALREQNRALLDAWGRIRQLYPELDVATRDAIYYHLCGFDTV